MRDGYAVVRGAFGADTARACREMIWDALAERGVRPGDRATWAPPLIRINWPHRGTAPRLMAQPAVCVRGGFTLDGSDPSPVARAIVRGLATAH